MKTIVEKVWLIEKLTENRKKHRDIFLRALDGYKTFALKRFEEQIARIKANKMPEHYINFTVPVDQTKEYDRSIKMLEAHVADTVELSEKDFSNYVLDAWDWKDQFVASNSTYTSISED